MPPGKIPSVDSCVLVVTGTVPTPVAGFAAVAEPVDDDDVVELLVDDVEDVVDEPPKTLWMSATSWELTRLSA